MNVENPGFEMTTTTEERVSRLEGVAEVWDRRFDDLNHRLDVMNRTIWRMFITLLTLQVGGFVALATLILRMGG